MSNHNNTSVSIVVIGLNEESNLDTTFKAINLIRGLAEPPELIYVDSGSTDHSVEIAARYTKKIFVERSRYPSAARGRNRGLIKACGEIVHFIDGDVEIDPDYLNSAISVFKNEDIHAVYGRLIEKRADFNFFSKILESAWDRNANTYSAATQAGGTYRRNILLSINGYDERIKLGEETELGLRLQSAGYNIFFINQPMGKHDYSINSIREYIRTFIKDGEAKSVQMFQKDRNSYYNNIRKSAYKNILFNVIAITLIVLLYKSKILLIVLFIFYITFLYFKYRLIKNKRGFYLIIYYVLMNLMKPFTFYGQMKIMLKAAFSINYRKLIVMDKMKLNLIL